MRVEQPGPDTFVGLRDTPNSYLGQANNLIDVNSGANALEFFDPTADWLPQYVLAAGDTMTGDLLNSNSGDLGSVANPWDEVYITTDYHIGTVGLTDTASGASGAGLIGIVTGVGSPTVDRIQEYLNNTGSSGFFTGGVLSDGGSGTIDITAGEGFIRTTADDNAELVSFTWDAVNGMVIPNDTTRYVFVDDTGTISLSASEFTEAVDNIMLGVVTDEGGVISHTFNLGVRLEESIGQAGRFIRRVLGVSRDIRKGGLIFGQSGDVNRDVTVTTGSLWWGRTEYPIPAFDTSGADTFDTYSAGGQEATGVSQWPNEQYDNAGTLTTMTNNRWAVLWWYIEPDGHIVMIYGRNQYVTEGQAEDELPPADSLPNRISSASVIAAKFIFQKSDDIATKIESAFGIPFTSSGVTDHGNLAGLSDDDHVQYLLIDGTRVMTGNLDMGSQNIINAVDITAGDGLGTPSIVINGAVETGRQLKWQTAGSDRWLLSTTNEAESGSDAGSDFTIRARTDAGAAIDTVMDITRAAGGAMVISRPITSGAITSSGASTFNSGSIDVDFTVNWDTGVGLFVQGSDGHVGIGTASPTARLKVIDDSINGDNTHGFMFQSSNNNGLDGGMLIRNFIPRLILEDTSTGADWFDWRVNTDKLILGHGENSNLFSRTGDNYIVVEVGGNVGIGTATPSNLLEVNKNQNAETSIIIDNQSTGTLAFSRLLTIANGDAQGSFISHGSNRTATRYGITVADYVEILTFNAAGLLIGSTQNVPIVFGTNNVERMRIVGGGDVGIGTTNPLSKLHLSESNSTPEIILERVDGGVGPGNDIGIISAYGGEDGGEAQVASIQFNPGAEWNDASSPCMIEFHTTPVNSTSNRLAMTLDDTGDLDLEVSTALFTPWRGNITFANNITNQTTSQFLDVENGLITTTTRGRPLVRAGSVTGIAGYVSVDSFTGGAILDMAVFVNATEVFQARNTISGTGVQTWTATQARGTDTFSAGDRIAVQIQVTGTVQYDLPIATIELTYDD